jgi:acylglycerol lipase
MAIDITESWVENKGTKLYTRTWTPQDNIIATVTFIHGLGEHCGRYDELFTYFAERGIKVKSFDQRGFGQTVRLGGIHGYGDGIETTFSDIHLVSKQTQIPAVPHFIMGQSMGGGLSLLYAHKYPQGLAGVIACSPLIHPGSFTMPSSIEYFALGKVFRWIIPTFCLPGKLDINNLSRDTNEVQKYKNDPLIHPWGSVGLCMFSSCSGRYCFECRRIAKESL